ncbi:uncharacterized protein LAESUDRAFT_813206 [Laetiporus sulphureus 93-53]|uniref:WW domain-containing protein n=1 Tax=Laetiporus sulphureus 93-53 TaxID=1314785 RepID=A0A165DZY4_9APHY|nr:uncharacterized protein LAESUDRAFT_813206 [Laetiporus sulphureus 93-53]KZT05979.1 hypothetical protein LAESUDRAFT_813206 [Laetiporus sulphureus 93-53]
MSYYPNQLPPLPEGWVQDYDQRANHPFWVDTRANPPRSIWVHPYEDEQFLREHPDIRDRLAAASASANPNLAPPPYTPRRHSFSGQGGSKNEYLNVDDSRYATSQPGSPSQGGSSSKSFLSNLMGKPQQQQQQYGYNQNGNAGYGQYQPPQGNPTSSGRKYLPLLGGMAGGLLLGDLLGGGGHHHGGLFGGGSGQTGGGGMFGGPFGGGFGGGGGGPFGGGFGGGGGGPFGGGFGGGPFGCGGGPGRF